MLLKTTLAPEVWMEAGRRPGCGDEWKPASQPQVTNISSYLILKTILLRRYPYHHFIDEETEAQELQLAASGARTQT